MRPPGIVVFNMVVAASGNIEGLNVSRLRASEKRIKRKDLLITMLRDNPKTSRKKLINKIGIGIDTIRVYMRELNKEGRLPEGALEGFMAQGSLKHRPTPESRRRHLLRMMRVNPRIPNSELAEGLATSIRTVERDRTKLRREGFITGTGRRLYVAHSVLGAKRELKMRRMLELLKEDPELTHGDMTNHLRVSKASITVYINTLRRRGDLPRDFHLRKKTSFKRVHRRLEAARARRKPVILEGIVAGLTHSEIAWQFRVSPWIVSTDISAMRRLEDPMFEEAEMRRDQLRPPSKPKPLSRDVAEENRDRALLEVGLTFEEANQQYLDWIENAGPDDSLLRVRAVEGCDD